VSDKCSKKKRKIVYASYHALVGASAKAFNNAAISQSALLKLRCTTMRFSIEMRSVGLVRIPERNVYNNGMPMLWETTVPLIFILIFHAACDAAMIV
jgi:hypothetical protein